MIHTYPLEEIGQINRQLDPCIIIIFGATGDLTARKLIPALYNLKRDNQLPPNFACIGFARREQSEEQFRKEQREAVGKYSRMQPLDESVWKEFEKHLFYHSSEFQKEEGYRSLKERLAQIDQEHGTKGNRIYYLSTQPEYFAVIIQQLKKQNLLYDVTTVKTKWSRVIIEKPFGHDLASAKNLQQQLLSHLSEEQIYRIDHYLGKETVQNILVFRFANSIFESLWNHRYIDHIQITVAESIGIESRGNFFEKEGLLRDIIQNHMMQLLTLIAMEPPANLHADAVRDEKVKVLQSIRPVINQDLDRIAIRGQYASGYTFGEKVVGYREEADVAKDSNIETYVALKLFIDNWRWAGVPFYLRGGKRLPKRATEIAIVFQRPPGILFSVQEKENNPNILVIRVQPNEGIALTINSKAPGPASPIQPVKMDFCYGAFFGLTPPEAYERLICECIFGDTTLFAREDEVFNSWAIFDPLLQHWAEKKEIFPNYTAGSWGPKEADQLIEADGRKWRLL